MIYQLNDRMPDLPGDDYFVAHNATVIGAVTLKKHASIWYNTVARADVDTITIGAETNIQDSSVLHVDYGFPLVIGDRVTVGHKVMLHGCHIDDESLIGINAVILNGARIGRHCLIGANSLITEGKEIPDGSMVIGAPGKVVRKLSEQEIEGLRISAANYVANATRHKAELAEFRAGSGRP